MTCYGGDNIAESCKSFLNWNHQIKELCGYQPIHFGWNRVEKSISKHESNVAGADPEVFERGGPEAIIYKNLEKGGPKSLKMAFECSFQSFSYKSFANIPPKGGALAPWAPPLNPPLCWQ